MRPVDADKLEADMTEKVFCGDGTYKVFGVSMDQIKKAPTITPPLNAPLTPDQLREMDGEPVYVHWVRRDWQRGGEWALVCLKWQGCKTADGGVVFFDRYGEWWLAYRRRPEGGDTNA